jgi:hypothetical protein
MVFGTQSAPRIHLTPPSSEKYTITTSWTQHIHEKRREPTISDHETLQPEFAHPHEILHEKASLTIASPKGGEAPLDPASVEMFKSDATSTKFLAEQKALWTNTHKLSDILPRADEFDALFYVGGHGRKLPTIPSLIYEPTTQPKEQKKE